jgi:hypothetical protein
MTNQLIVLLDGSEVGVVHCKKARLSFVYTDTWKADPTACPLSLGEDCAGAVQFVGPERRRC